MNTHTPEKSAKNSNLPWYIAAAVIVLIVIVAVISGRDKGLTTDLDARQAQLESDPKLAENLNSPRNNFDPKTYKLDAKQSTIAWSYGEYSGTIPLSTGTLVVTDKNRIGEFYVQADATDTTVEAGNNSQVKNFITNNGKKLVFQALTVLPNTNDDAFTIAFQFEALGRKTSLASGMNVKKLETGGIQVSGDVYLDAKTVLQASGYTAAKESMKLKVNYVFK